MKKGKPDPELLDIINSVKGRTDLTWCQKCDEIIKFKQKTRGLKGIHCSVYPEEGKNPSAEELAYYFFKLIESEAQGEFYEHEAEDVL